MATVLHHILITGAPGKCSVYFSDNSFALGTQVRLEMDAYVAAIFCTICFRVGFPPFVWRDPS